MYFGEYLVQQKVLTHDQLVEVLSIQMDSIPSLLRIINEVKLISSDQLLNCINKNQRNNFDISKILIDEKVCDENKIQELLKIQAGRKKMVGEIIIELKILNSEEVEKFLNSFLKSNHSNQETNKIVPEKEIEINQAALDSLKELEEKISVNKKVEVTTIEHKNLFVDEFLQAFSQKSLKKLIKLLEIIEGSLIDASDTSNYINSLYRETHLIKGASSISNLQSFSEVITLWDQSIEKSLNLNLNDLKSWYKKSISTFKISLGYLWELRESIEANKSEHIFLNSPENKELHNHIIQTLKPLI